MHEVTPTVTIVLCDLKHSPILSLRFWEWSLGLPHFKGFFFVLHFHKAEEWLKQERPDLIHHNDAVRWTNEAQLQIMYNTVSPSLVRIPDVWMVETTHSTCEWTWSLWTPTKEILFVPWVYQWGCDEIKTVDQTQLCHYRQSLLPQKISNLQYHAYWCWFTLKIEVKQLTLVCRTNCIRQPERQLPWCINNRAQSILQPQHTDNLQDICEGVLKNTHFKVEFFAHASRRLPHRC